MKINFQSIKQAERLSSNEYVLTTIDNDVIHVALTTDESAKVNLSIRINGLYWHKNEVAESDCALMAAIRDYHWNQENKKADALRARAQVVAASVFQL